jgi:hypothetical protein
MKVDGIINYHDVALPDEKAIRLIGNDVLFCPMQGSH